MVSAYRCITSLLINSLVGITAHFLDASLKRRDFLLALPQRDGRHFGSEVAKDIRAVLEDFGILDKIGYFMGDNDDKNDTCIKDLAAEFEFDFYERRLHYIGHIINLMANALLYSYYNI